MTTLDTNPLNSPIKNFQNFNTFTLNSTITITSDNLSAEIINLISATEKRAFPALMAIVAHSMPTTELVTGANIVKHLGSPMFDGKVLNTKTRRGAGRQLSRIVAAVKYFPSVIVGTSLQDLVADSTSLDESVELITKRLSDNYLRFDMSKSDYVSFAPVTEETSVDTGTTSDEDKSDEQALAVIKASQEIAEANAEALQAKLDKIMAITETELKSVKAYKDAMLTIGLIIVESAIDAQIMAKRLPSGNLLAKGTYGH